MHRKWILTTAAALGLSLSAAAGTASADVLYNNRGTGPDGLDTFDSTGITGDVLDDATVGQGPGQYNATGIILGYYNNSLTTSNVEVLVTFWDNVDYNVPDAGVVNTGPGTTFRIPVAAAPSNDILGFVGYGETALLTLTGGQLLDDASFGITVKFVETGTNTLSQLVSPIFRDVPINFGTSDGFFAIDSNNNGVINGIEIQTWQDPPAFPNDANLYFQLEGTVVPEPGAAALLGAAGLAVLRRRRTA